MNITAPFPTPIALRPDGLCAASSFPANPARAGQRPWRRLIGLAGLFLLAAGTAPAGTHTWSGAGGNTLWSNAANWSSGGAPVSGETNVVLIFPANATNYTSTQNVNNLSVDRMEFSKPTPAFTSYTFPNGGVPLALTGAAGENIWVKDASASVIWQPALTLQNTCRVNCANQTSIFDFQGVVSGNGGLVKQGPGSLRFSTGGAANTFLGTLRVESGSVALNKIVGTPCFGGNLEIISGNVNIVRSNQIPDTATITIGVGTLNTSPEGGVAGVTERIGPVIFTGTVATTNLRASSPNTITLGGTVSCAAGADIRARIVADSPSGQITLDGTTRLFNVPAATSRLEIEGNLADGGAAGGFTKQGAGEMILLDATTFTGPASVTAGTLILADNQALGGTAGATTVQAGGTLELGYLFAGVSLPAGETIHLSGVVNAPLSSSIAGSLVLSGTPTLSTNVGDTLTHTGVISGSGAPLNIGGQGTVIMAGTASNTMGGTVSVSGGCNLHLNKTNGNAIPGTLKFDGGGSVKLLAPNQIADGGSVWMAVSGIFDLNSQNEAVGFLFGTEGNGGRVTLGDATLTLNGTTNVQFGIASSPGRTAISGSAMSKIRKLGSNTWTLHHTTPPGSGPFPTLSIEAGTVDLNNQWPGPIEAKGGLLKGHATTGPITGMGGQICLCDFSAASFSGTATILSAINGDTPGTGFDRLVSTGPVNLTGQTLQASLGAFLPMTHGRFTIVKNESGSPVTGTFNGLPEGALLTLNGQTFRITYQGGSLERDVQLIFLGFGTPAPEITALTRTGKSVTLAIGWLPSKAGKLVRIQEATGTPDLLSRWGQLGSVTLDAEGRGTYTTTEFQEQGFYRLVTN